MICVCDKINVTSQEKSDKELLFGGFRLKMCYFFVNYIGGEIEKIQNITMITEKNTNFNHSFF